MSDQDNFYTVQKILARKRTKQGSYCYKIKWKNWPISTSTWQPAEHLEYVKNMVNKYDRFCDMRRGKKRIGRQKKQEKSSDEDKSQQNLMENEGIVGGKKTTNESQIKQNQQDNEKNINKGKQPSSIFQIVKNCRKKENILQNEITKNSNTILDSALNKEQSKERRKNKAKIGRINHIRAVNQRRRQKKRRQLEQRESEKEQKINGDISKVEALLKNKKKRIKKDETILNLSNQNDQNENKIVKIKRKYIRKATNNIEIKSRRRPKPTIEISNEEKKIQQDKNQEIKTQKKRERKYERPGRPRKILSEEQLLLKKEKIRMRRKYTRRGRPNVLLSEEEKQKRREIRRLKLRKYDRRGRPKKQQTQQQIERKKQILRQKRKIRRIQQIRIAQLAEIVQNPIRAKRIQFSNQKKIDSDYGDVMIKQEVNEADIIKIKQIDQWNLRQNIGFIESYQQLQKQKEINDQSQILQQQQPYRIPIYTPLQALNFKQGNLNLSQQSYPKLQQKKRNSRKRKNYDKIKRRQNPKRRKQRSFSNLFTYEKSKDLSRIPEQVLQTSQIKKVELKVKEGAASKVLDSLSQMIQKQTLREQLLNYNGEKNLPNKALYQDDKILVQFRNENDQKCVIETEQLAKYCGNWLKCYYQSYI